MGVVSRVDFFLINERGLKIEFDLMVEIELGEWREGVCEVKCVRGD